MAFFLTLIQPQRRRKCRAVTFVPEWDKSHFSRCQKKLPSAIVLHDPRMIQGGHVAKVTELSLSKISYHFSLLESRNLKPNFEQLCGLRVGPILEQLIIPERNISAGRLEAIFTST